MRCPSCGAEVDSSAPSCPTCGVSLASAEARATTRLGRDALGDTRPIVEAEDEPRTSQAASPFGPRRAGYDFLYSLRRSFVAGGWRDATYAACIGFLALLCVGGVLLVAAKLQYPDLGSDSSPLSTLVSIVILALGSLRVPVHVGDLTVTALPLGALAVSAFALSWAMEPAIRRRDVTGLRARCLAGAKIALPFAALCWLAALLFRFRGGTSPTHAGAAGALLLGLVWGGLFGALGGVRSAGRIRTIARAAAATLRRRGATVWEGAVAAGVELGTMLAFAAVAALVWVIVGLARGAPLPDFGAGDAFAAAIYLMAFLPNVLVAVVALALGAPLHVGAQITIGARKVGALKTFSLWHWGGHGVRWYTLLLVVVPMVATVAGGWVARRRAPTRDRFGAVAIGASLLAVTLSLLAWLGEARLGAGLVRRHGFAVVAPNALLVLLLALAWGLAGGMAGWALADRRQPKGEPRDESGEGSA